MEILENIKKILDSDAGLVVEDLKHPDKKIVVDNRFSLLMKTIDSIDNKDDFFYAKLISLFGYYINQLYNKEIIQAPNLVFDKNGEIVFQDNRFPNLYEISMLEDANKTFATNLFEYVCSILEKNVDIKLDETALKSLFNLNSTFVYQTNSHRNKNCKLQRYLHYKKLAEIIKKNQTLKKSNISLDDLYQILLDTYQIDNEDVFPILVIPEQFHQSHGRIDSYLSRCGNSVTFVRITNIIKKYFDKEYDRYSLVNGNNEIQFELLINELIESGPSVDDYNFIHQILTSDKIPINYNKEVSDYFGNSMTLINQLASTCHKTIIEDLLSKKDNIKPYYAGMGIYNLYAITGEYEKAMDSFETIYSFHCDFCDEYNTWDKFGYVRADYHYEDSLSKFIGLMCHSFVENNTDYLEIFNYIMQILSSKKLSYVNLEKILPPIKEVLLEDDFNIVLNSLLEKHRNKNLDFVSVEEEQDMFTRYIIRKVREDDIPNYIERIKGKTKVLKNTKKDN